MVRGIFFLATDGDNHRIQKFTTEGQFLTAVGTEGSQPLQFNDPSGIVYNASNNKVYVADTYNHSVQVLNSDLTFSSTFGGHGSGKGQFESPWSIACDSTGNVYVADTLNHHIQVFTAEGRFLRMFGRHGVGRGQLRWPVGVAIDTSGLAVSGTITVSQCSPLKVSLCHSLAGKGVDQESCHILLD